MREEVSTIVGAPGSPYSRKLRAVLRYRRIPFVWVQAGGIESRALPRPKVELLPQWVVRGANGELEARTDSTPLIRELQASHSGREVIPPDPTVAFLDARLEVSRFVMGARPGASDFGLYGQLTQLAGSDPTPSALAHRVADQPRQDAGGARRPGRRVHLRVQPSGAK